MRKRAIWMTHGGGAEARIGPNSLIQTVQALRKDAGDDLTRDVLQSGGMGWLLEQPPAQMVPEAQFLDLVRVLVRRLGTEHSEDLLRHSGALTAGYLLQNRIPYPFQRLLGLLPRRLRLRLLLAAIRRHAWTFVGSGHFSYRLGRAPRLRIARTDQTQDPVYSFYGGTFGALFQALVDPGMSLAEQISRDGTGSVCIYGLTYSLFSGKGVGAHSPRR